MKTLMTFAIVSLLTMTFAQISLAADRPNVLFILTDDQRYDALSCMGHPHLKDSSHRSAC